MCFMHVRIVIIFWDYLRQKQKGYLVNNMKINFNKIEHISSVDYPGKSACVVFFNGCPWRCGYCHNKQTWDEVNMVDVDYVKYQIKSCLPFVNAVVFSGGEPTFHRYQLIELCIYAKSLGLYVGVETNGYDPFCLSKLINVVDKIFLDIKAPINSAIGYYRATKNINAYENINMSITLDLPIEIRIVDINKYITKDIIKSIKTNHKVTILPYIKRK